MVGRRRDQVVEERAGVAPVPPCSSAAGRRTAPRHPRVRDSLRRMIPATLGRGCERYCSRTGASCCRMNSDRDTPRSSAARVRSASVR